MVMIAVAAVVFALAVRFSGYVHADQPSTGPHRCAAIACLIGHLVPVSSNLLGR